MTRPKPRPEISVKFRGNRVPPNWWVRPSCWKDWKRWGRDVGSMPGRVMFFFAGKIPIPESVTSISMKFGSRLRVVTRMCPDAGVNLIAFLEFQNLIG